MPIIRPWQCKYRTTSIVLNVRQWPTSLSLWSRHSGLLRRLLNGCEALCTRQWCLSPSSNFAQVWTLTIEIGVHPNNNKWGKCHVVPCMYEWAWVGIHHHVFITHTRYVVVGKVTNQELWAEQSLCLNHNAYPKRTITADNEGHCALKGNRDVRMISGQSRRNRAFQYVQNCAKPR